MEELPIKIPSKDSKPIRKEGKFTIYQSPDGTQFKAFTVDENSFRNRALNVEERTDAIQKPKEELKLVEKKEPEPIPHWTAQGYGDPKMSVITADNRSKWQRAQDDKKTKAWLAAEHKKDIDQKVTNYMLLPAGILLAQATPAAPYVNATLFAHSTNNLHDQYQNGTLGFNLETGMNTLGLIPGLSSVKAATTPIWAPVAAKTFNGIKNYRMAKAFDNIVRSEIKKKDWFNKNFPQYTYKPQPYNNRLGLPEADPNTFYHYMYYPSPININGEGVVRFSNFTIKPKYNGLNERIWWDKGDVPTGDVVLSSKSKYIDEHVLSHPEKYSPYRGYYENSYYTSGDVPINEVDIYTKNPFTGYYDGPHNTITYNPSKQVEGKTYLGLFERQSELTEAERLGIPKAERNLKPRTKQDIERKQEWFEMQPLLQHTPYRGDWLALQLNRLNNGGFKKIGLDPNKKVVVNTKVSPGLSPYTKLNKNGEYEVDAKTFLNAQAKPNVRVKDPENMDYTYNPEFKIILEPDIEDFYNYKFPNSITAHEHFHAISDLTRDIGEDVITLFPGVDYSLLSPKVRDYFIRYNGDEMLNRLGQIKNLYGITKTNRPVTPTMFNYAKKNYFKMGLNDNDMSSFFRAIVDPKLFLKHANPLVSGVAIPTVITTKAMNNDKTESKKQGGKLIKKQ